MADFHEFDVACAAPVRFVPPRMRKDQLVHMKFTTRVRVPVLSGADAPLVLLAHRGDQRIERRKVGDHRVGLLASENTSEIARIREDLLKPTNSAFHLSDGRGDPPWSIQASAAIAGAVPPGARIVVDDRDLVLSKVHEAAKGLAVIDGLVYRAEPSDPMHLLYRSSYHPDHLDPARKEFHRRVFDRRGNRDGGVAFRLDRAGVLDEVAEHCAARSGMVVDAHHSDVRVEVMDIGEATFQEDRHNARFALMAALRHGKGFLEEFDPGTIHCMGDIRRMLLGLDDGPLDADAAGRLLAQLVDAVPRRDDTWLFHASLEMGRKAMDLSLPSQDLAPDDHMALSGLAPGL